MPNTRRGPEGPLPPWRGRVSVPARPRERPALPLPPVQKPRFASSRPGNVAGGPAGALGGFPQSEPLPRLHAPPVFHDSACKPRTSVPVPTEAGVRPALPRIIPTRHPVALAFLPRFCTWGRRSSWRITGSSGVKQPERNESQIWVSVTSGAETAGTVCDKDQRIMCHRSIRLCYYS